MTPFSFEWHWNIEYIIFFGLLYIALTIVGVGLIYTWVKTWHDLERGGESKDTPEELSFRSKYSEY